MYPLPKLGVFGDNIRVVRGPRIETDDLDASMLRASRTEALAQVRLEIGPGADDQGREPSATRHVNVTALSKSS